MDFNKMTVEELDELINKLIQLRDIKRMQMDAEVDLSATINKIANDVSSILTKEEEL